MDRLSITSSHCAAQQEDVNETQQARVEDVARDFHTERLIESHCYVSNLLHTFVSFI